MRKLGFYGMVVVVLCLSSSILAAERKHGFGVGLVSSNAEVLNTDVDFAGFSVFGKVGINKNWGILISYRDVDDDEDLLFGEKDEYTEIGVHGVYMFRSEYRLRPHFKFGFVNTDLEVSIPGESLSDDGTGFSLGGGLEAGSQKIAFFADVDAATVELFGEDFDFVSLVVGVIFKL